MDQLISFQYFYVCIHYSGGLFQGWVTGRMKDVLLWVWPFDFMLVFVDKAIMANLFMCLYYWFFLNCWPYVSGFSILCRRAFIDCFYCLHQDNSRHSDNGFLLFADFFCMFFSSNYIFCYFLFLNKKNQNGLKWTWPLCFIVFIFVINNLTIWFIFPKKI